MRPWRPKPDAWGLAQCTLWEGCKVVSFGCLRLWEQAGEIGGKARPTVGGSEPAVQHRVMAMGPSTRRRNI